MRNPVTILTNDDYNGEDTEIEIPSYFDKQDWQIHKTYYVQVSHIYDLSHFWVITKIKEADILQTYLNDFYSNHKDDYRVVPEDLWAKMPCIVYTEENYRRAVLVDTPIFLGYSNWVFAFLIDVGKMATVAFEDIYYMRENMYDVPRFAVRATLPGFGPVNSFTWPEKAVESFTSLVQNKVLAGQLINKDSHNKVLFLRLDEYNSSTKTFSSINDTLLLKHLGKNMTISNLREYEINMAKKRIRLKQRSGVNAPIPSFNQIENGMCTGTYKASLMISEYLT